MAGSTAGEGKKNPCQKLACEIQTCLAKNDYNEKRCKGVIDAWEKCEKEHAAGGGREREGGETQEGGRATTEKRTGDLRSPTTALVHDKLS
jgi:hypothetical protein